MRAAISERPWRAPVAKRAARCAVALAVGAVHRRDCPAQILEVKDLTTFDHKNNRECKVPRDGVEYTITVEWRLSHLGPHNRDQLGEALKVTPLPGGRAIEREPVHVQVMQGHRAAWLSRPEAAKRLAPSWLAGSLATGEPSGTPRR